MTSSRFDPGSTSVRPQKPWTSPFYGSMNGPGLKTLLKECKTYFSQFNFLQTTIADKTCDCKIILFLTSKDHQFCKKPKSDWIIARTSISRITWPHQVSTIWIYSYIPKIEHKYCCFSYLCNMNNIGGTKMQFDIGLGFMGLMLKENDQLHNLPD